MDEIRENFELRNEDLKKKTAREIFEGDRRALALVPPHIRQKVKTDDYDDENDYFQKTSYFLVPYKEVVKKNQEAIVALIIASCIDCFSLLLGSIKSRFLFFRSVAALFVSIFSGVKRLNVTLSEVWKQDAEPFENLEEAEGLRDVVTTIKLLDGKGSDFLCRFYNSIDLHTKKIDYKILLDGLNNDSFKVGYRMLIDAMQIRPLEWIEECVEEENNQVSSNHQSNGSTASSLLFGFPFFNQGTSKVNSKPAEVNGKSSEVNGKTCIVNKVNSEVNGKSSEVKPEYMFYTTERNKSFRVKPTSYRALTKWITQEMSQQLQLENDRSQANASLEVGVAEIKIYT